MRGARTTAAAAALAAALALPAARAADAPAAPPAPPAAPAIRPVEAPAAGARKAASPERLVVRGRYLVRTAGCNECHTAGYTSASGRVAEERWLLGDTLGRRGSWGTSYPANLRLLLGGLAEGEWVEKARALRTRPPMPWYALREMAGPDLEAIYHFVRRLGPAGIAAPAAVPAGKEPKPPFVLYPQPPRP